MVERSPAVCLIPLLSLLGGCSYESYRRAHSHPLEASMMGQPVPLRFFSAGTSAQWHSFWFEGATIPLTCDKPMVFPVKGSPERAIDFTQFSVALSARLFSRGRIEVRPDPTTAPQVNAMMRQQTAQAQGARGINGGAFYIDKITDDYVDIAMDVDDNLVHLVGTFRANLCKN